MTFFVCTPTETGYSHAEFDTTDLAEENCPDGSWIIVTDGNEITHARFDTPGVAIRSVKRALKWRASS